VFPGGSRSNSCWNEDTSREYDRFHAVNRVRCARLASRAMPKKRRSQLNSAVVRGVGCHKAP
jgi:hypothetical protein